MTYLHLLMSPPGDGGSPWPNLIFLGAIVLVFYFFMIRPQQKKAKDLKKFRENLKKGDKVVTIGGVHGKIAELRDTTLIIEVEGGNRLKIEKGAVSIEFTGNAQAGSELEKS